MTITTQVFSSSYSGNGVTDTFNINFPFDEDPDRIQVLLNNVLQVAGYTVENAGPNWVVSFITPPAAGVGVRLQRHTPITQETEYEPNDEFPAASHEAALDKLTMIAQELSGSGDSEGGSGLIDGTYGDINVSGNGTILTVINGAISFGKMQNITGPVFMGQSAGTGAPETIDPTEAAGLLPVFTSIAKGLAPASGGGSSNFLRADGSWAAPALSSVWGAIIGEITDQTDLVAALATKSNVSHTHVMNDITDASALGKTVLGIADATALTALLNNFSTTADGLTPQSPGGTTTFLRADGTWQTPPGGGGGGGPPPDGDYVDVTISGAGTVITINPDVVTNAKMANMAANTVKGAITAGNPIDLTQTELTTLVNQFTSGLKGVVPASGGGTTNFLRADGGWSAPTIAWGGITGVLSNQTDLQSALNAKQASDAALTSIAALGTAADRMIYTTGVDTFAETPITSLGRNLLDDATQGAMQSTLGLVPGTNVQAFDADLLSIAGLSATTNNIIQSVASAWASRTPTQVTATLDAMVGDSGAGGTKGLAPAPAAGDAAAEKFLKANGTWATPAGGASLPAGVIMDYAGSSAPSGWQLCDGTALNRTTFADLFTAIGTAFGAGDGSTTFNVPDLRGKVSLGAGAGTISDTQAAANWNTSDIITVTSGRWFTGMMVQVTTTGTLPGGISAATNYFVRRLSATTISLYTSLAGAMRTRSPNGEAVSTTGIVNITSTGSGNHTLTHVLTTRTLADMLGAEAHGLTHDELPQINAVSPFDANATRSDSPSIMNLSGTWGGDQTHNNMPPSLVLNKIIKT